MTWSAGCGNRGGSRAGCGADSIQAGRFSPRRSSPWRRIGHRAFRRLFRLLLQMPDPLYAAAIPGTLHAHRRTSPPRLLS